MLRLTLLLSTLLFVSGCANQHFNVPPIPIVGNNISQAQGHLKTADSVVEKVKPHSDSTGKEMIGIVQDEHKNADKNLVDANKEIVNVQKAFDVQVGLTKKANDRADKAEQETKKVKSTVGYRVQMLLIKVGYILLGLLALHFALGIASVFVTGPIGPILKFAGGVVNPIAWFQFVIDHLYLKKTINTLITGQ
jgi:hypothetical protein